MYLFWDIAVHPILKSLQPRTIIEIGADCGHLTEKLLNYCQQHDASLHVIDPLAKYDVEGWRQRYGDTFVFHSELSLNALPSVPNGDIVLIDGDRNWYTVFHELKLIEKRCTTEQQAFPVVLLCNIDWPYGRRDSYYSPENIPLGYLQAYQQQGLHLDSPDLAESGGFNAHLHHSVGENGPRNGVRTAIEDFIDASPLDLSLYTLPGFHGLGILVSDTGQQRYPELTGFLKKLAITPEYERLIHSLERYRLKGEIEKLQYKAEIKDHQEEIAESRKEISESRKEIAESKKEAAALKKKIETLQQANLREVDRRKQEVKKLSKQVARSAQQAVRLRRRLQYSQNLFIHIGRDKTGSSAIQSWLANNATKLAKKGFSYTVNDEDSLHYRISSGNGKVLRAYLLEKSDEQKVLNHYFKHDHANTIISSEKLPRDPESLERLNAFCRRHQIHLVAIAYLRSPVDLFYSKYTQHVKRGNYLSTFKDFLNNVVPSHSHIKDAIAISKYIDDIELVHYNENQGNIISPFCEILGIRTSGLESLPQKVNRSITFSEIVIIQLFVRWRQKHFGDLDTSKFSSIISDWLVNNFPERQSEMVVNEEILAIISEKCHDQIVDFNQSLGRKFGIEIGIGDSTNYDNLVRDKQFLDIDIDVLRDVSQYLAEEAALEPDCLTAFADELREIDAPSSKFFYLASKTALSEPDLRSGQ